jgi:hypothetical protein
MENYLAHRYSNITEEEKQSPGILGPYPGKTTYPESEKEIPESGMNVTAINIQYYILPNGDYRIEEREEKIIIFPKPVFSVTV